MKRFLILVLLSMVFFTCSIPDEPDVDPPIVAIIYPTEGNRLSGIVPVSIVAGDNNKVQKVEFYLDGIMLREWSGRPYSFQWDVEPYADGTVHSISAAAYDGENNIGVTPTISVQLIKSSDFKEDNIPPEIEMVYPLGGEVIGDTVRVTFLASDNIGISKVELYRNGLLVDSDHAPPYSFLVNSSSFPMGSSQTFFGIAYDSVGNTAVSNNATVTRGSSTQNGDNLDPVTAIIFPTTGANVDSVVHFIVDAQDNETISRVMLYRNGVMIGSDDSFPYEFDWDATRYPYGSSHTFFSEAIDNSGNIGFSTTITITRDTTVIPIEPTETNPPVVSILSPVGGDTLSGTIPIRVDVIDESLIDSVLFFVDGVELLNDRTEPYEFNLNTENYPNASRHTLYIKAYDEHGNIGTDFLIMLFR